MNYICSQFNFKSSKMRKLLFAALFLLAASISFAGDYLTNTNQSVKFLRNPSRAGAIGLDGIYYNPAGVAFMSQGWHLQFNWQSPHQTRNTYVNYGPLFGANYADPGTAEADGTFGRKFKGKVDVLIQPSLFAAYNTGDWSFQAGFGIVGGGGTCKFPNGVGTFEALVGQIGMSTLGAGFGGYSLNSYVEGQSYYYGITLAAARKITDKLSVSLGLRGIIGANHYKGTVDNITFRTVTGDIIPVDNSYKLDCKQSGFSVAPIIGVDYMPAEWLNLSARYEFRTALKLKSKANNNEAFNALAGGMPAFAAFMDKAESYADMPSSISAGAQVSPISKLRISAGYNHYFDLDTKQWNTDLLKDTDEITFGVEYDVTDRLTLSTGIQNTMYNQKEANYSDLSFIMDCFSIGAGAKIALTDNINLDVAYFRSSYKSHTKQQTIGYTQYKRTNFVLGLGIDVSF